jgi:hypothetical protein
VTRGPIAKPQVVRDVFPILVVQDPIFGAGPVTRVLSDRFLVAIDRVRGVGQQSPRIWPLTIMTADDVDRLSTAVQVSGARIDSFLKAFHRAHPSRMISLADLTRFAHEVRRWSCGSLPEFANPFFQPFASRLNPVWIVRLGDAHRLVPDEHRDVLDPLCVRRA